MLKQIIFLSTTALALAAQSYQIDSSHSGASFRVKHMMATNVSGRFSNLKGTVTFDEKNVGKSSIDATIDVDTINTNEPKRDAHLKSPDFFDVAKFPQMSFRSTRIYKADGVMKADGNLTLH